MWDHDDYEAKPQDAGRYDVDDFEWDETSHYYNWTRDGTHVGFAFDDATGRHKVLFTDILERVHNESQAALRHEAAKLGCWEGSYTPDICCSNVGWSNCWSYPYSFESCCSGWTTEKDQAFLDFVQGVLTSNVGVGFVESDMSHPHACFFAGMLAATQEKKGRTLVEVGVFEGTFAEIILRHLFHLKLMPERYFVVDLWQSKPEDDTWRNTEHQRRNFLSTAENLAPYWPVVRFVQEYSNVAARLFLDESVDFVFLDASHFHSDVARDLHAWWPKVRVGGFLAGHDYVPYKPSMFSGVLGAVQIFAKSIGASSVLISVVGTSFVIRKDQ